jgi:hypothetical protein
MYCCCSASYCCAVAECTVVVALVTVALLPNVLFFCSASYCSAVAECTVVVALVTVALLLFGCCSLSSTQQDTLYPVTFQTDNKGSGALQKKLKIFIQSA